jgi:dTDP-4-dehydrorhamnose 3,5-epimerase
MIFTPTRIPEAFILDLERRADARGFFARAWCAEEFAAHGLSTSIAQANLSFTDRAGTLRGLHYQLAPHEEAKVMRCTQGAIFDVIVDLREESPTCGEWLGVELSADNHRMLYVPPGCAHGYQALTDAAEVFYLVSTGYAAGAEHGIRYDDPAFGIEWPREITLVSEKDRGWPDYLHGER